jgi:hypothetical protein
MSHFFTCEFLLKGVESMNWHLARGPTLTLSNRKEEVATQRGSSKEDPT